MHTNYVNNLIETIKNMSENDYAFFEKTSYEYLSPVSFLYPCLFPLPQAKKSVPTAK